MGRYKPFLLLFIVLIYFSSAFGFYQGVSLSKPPNKYFVVTSQNHAHEDARNSINVDDYGAKGNGNDDSEAFKRAWNKACSSNGSLFVVPQNKVYHLKPVTFYGPCHSGFTMKIYGTIKASTDRSDYAQDLRHWLVFENLQEFNIEGGGIIDGNGRQWWENSCKIKKNQPCNKRAPTAVTFRDCNNLTVDNIRMKNSQQMHMTFDNCQNVKASNLLVFAPEKSPNTDGIHITNTQNITISSSVVRTGDDCVSIVSGSKNVLVTDLICGPGHGISIGSLGKDKSNDQVSDITVNRATLTNTTNGVRIKTWQGGSGYAENIKFLNIVMQKVKNPIIIDQNYCDREQDCPEQNNAVQVKDVLYSNIRGTSKSEMAIKLDCSKTFPCQGIQLQNVIIYRDGGIAKASYTNVNDLETKGMVFPQFSKLDI